MLTNINSNFLSAIQLQITESPEKNADDSFDNDATIEIDTTLEVFSKISVGDKVYNKQITETTRIKLTSTSGHLLQQWNMNCNNKLISCKKAIFIIQQEQSHQLDNQEQHPCDFLVQLSYKLKQAELKQEMNLFLLLFKEQILFELKTYFLVLCVFQFSLMIQ